MVPNGWVEGKVNDLLLGLESGVSVNGTEREMGANEKAVLKVSAVSYGVFDPLAIKVIEDPQELSRAKVNPKIGQIIVSRSNTENLVGASVYIDQNYPDLFLPDKLWQTIPKPNTNMKWLSYILASEHARYTLSKLATGTSGSMKNITQSELLSLKILIPPLVEQTQIAQILSTWDQAISATEKMLENSQQQKKSLMQQLLTGSKRLFVEKNVKFSGLWVSNDINSIFDICRGSVQETLEFGKYYLVVMGSISETGKLVRKESTNSQADLLKYGDLVMPERDIGKGLIIGRTALIQEDGKYILGPNVLRLRVKDYKKHNSKFWNYLFNSGEVRRKVKRLVSGTGQLMLTGKEIKNIRITFPSDIEEQKKIAEFLEIADQEIDTLQKKLDCLKQEKKALMQQLLTGKKRVKVAA